MNNGKRRKQTNRVIEQPWSWVILGLLIVGLIVFGTLSGPNTIF